MKKSFLKSLIFLPTFYFLNLAVFAFENVITIPQVNLKIATFKNFESRPIQFPNTYSKNGNQSQKWYKIIDIWRYKQILGCWGNENLTLIIAAMSIDIPINSTDFILEKQLESVKLNIIDSTVAQDKKRKWLEEFTGQKIKDNTKMVETHNGFRIEQFVTERKDSNTYIFLVFNNDLLKYNYAFIYISNSLLNNAGLNSIYDSIVSVKYDARINNKQEKVISNLTNKPTNETNNNITKLLVAQNIANFKDWWGFETDGHIVITNLDKSSKFVQTTIDELKFSKKLFSLFYPDKVGSKDLAIVRIFKDRDDYLHYVGRENSNSYGIWVPGKRELVVSPFEIRSASKKYEETFNILRHEAFHQYLYYSTKGLSSSPWFNEGNAAFFEGVKFIRPNVFIQPVDRYLKTVMGMINANNTLDITSLLEMNYNQFYNKGTDINHGSDENYALAWAVVYFLQKGSPIIKKMYGRNYTKILNEYYNALYETKRFDVADQRAWAGINMKQFTKDFCNFYKDSGLRQQADNYDIVDYLMKSKRNN